MKEHWLSNFISPKMCLCWPRIDFRFSFLIQREDVNIPQGRTLAALLKLYVVFTECSHCWVKIVFSPILVDRALVWSSNSNRLLVQSLRLRRAEDAFHDFWFQDWGKPRQNLKFCWDHFGTLVPIRTMSIDWDSSTSTGYESHCCHNFVQQVTIKLHQTGDYKIAPYIQASL